MHARNCREISDETLVTNCLNGNREFMGILYQRNYNNVYFLVLSIIKDKNMAMDLTQDIFLKVFETLNSFRGNSRFSTWLYAIARNHSLEFLRKQQKNKYERIELYVHVPDEEFNPDEETVSENQRNFVLKELMGNMELDQHILYQKYVMQLSIKDIKNKLQISESAVKMRLQRARNKIGRRIQYLPKAV